jgi:hypothetical protein
LAVGARERPEPALRTPLGKEKSFVLFQYTPFWGILNGELSLAGESEKKEEIAL